ncbi:MAG: hypothetical protein Q7J34_11610 [Bacteroidales bacterium]|nr:hypothetical protein [Bacteroidales bacterium]
MKLYYKQLLSLFVALFCLPFVASSQNSTCNTSSVFCSANTITYPAGVGTGSAPAGPCYQCLSTRPNPAWFYMQMQNNGNVTIKIESSNPPRDIDFILWGPFDNPTSPCLAGLTCDKVEDCSYSGASTEYADITGGLAGEFYILMITNYSNQATTITFSQTNLEAPGAGGLNCNIVFECTVVDIFTSVSDCNSTNNTYTVSGHINFTNPPTTGTLMITDNSGISQIFYPPFTSPRTYSLSGIPCDGLAHQLTATFSANDLCTRIESYNAPTSLCANAIIKGGGDACAGTPVPVTITMTGGPPPYTFTYAINGINQPPVINYNSTSPYIINATTEGTYTLVSVTNGTCSGVLNGSAVVGQWPLPVINLNNEYTACQGTPIMLDAGPGFIQYNWNTGAITQSIFATLPGSYSVTVKNNLNCLSTKNINIIHHLLPGSLNIRHQ